MKKAFTLFTAALAAISAWAAAPELLFMEKPVEAGVTYQAPYVVDDLGFMSIYQQKSWLSLKGTVGKFVTISVKADREIAICSLTGQCTNTDNEVRSAELSAKDPYLESQEGDMVTVGLEIHGLDVPVFGDDFDPKTDLTVTNVEVQAWYNDSPSEVATAKVILTNKSQEELAGIADVTNDASAAITFNAGNVLNYNVAVPTKLALYTPAGTLVMSRTIASVGSLSLDSLTPGIYIYTAGNKSGKILVR